MNKGCRLILHWDINETILVGDEAGGDSREDCLNKILAKSAFVRVKSSQPKTIRRINQLEDREEDDIRTKSILSPRSSKIKVSTTTKLPTSTSTLSLTKADLDTKTNEIDKSENEFLFSQTTVHVHPTHWWDGTPMITQSNSCPLENHSVSKTKDHQINSSSDQQQSLSVPPLYTDWNWPENSCPYYRTSFKNKGSKFITHEGWIYKPIYDRMESMLVTPSMKSKSANSGLTINNTSPLPPIIWNILPAFFETLMVLFPSEDPSTDNRTNLTTSVSRTLCQSEALESNPISNGNSSNKHYNYKPRESSISIVLRTFGSDLAQIIDVITLFAKGEHPSYPNYRNRNLIMSPKSPLVRGRWTTHQNASLHHHQKDERHNYETELSCFKSDGLKTTTMLTYKLWDWDEKNCIAETESSVLDFIHSNTICGIQDDYKFWKDNQFQPWAGKPVWIECNDEYHHLLMDDNIHNLIDYSIAGIRREQQNQSFESLNSMQILQNHGIHLLRVPTIEPIINTNWFLERIKEARTRFQSKM